MNALFTLALLLVASSSASTAQMVTYDLSQGEFLIECDEADSYCIMSNNSYFWRMRWDSPYIVVDDNRFDPQRAFHFTGDSVGELMGYRCSNYFYKSDPLDFCHMTCSDTCTCYNNPNDFSWDSLPSQIRPETNPNVSPCIVNATIQGVSILPPEKLITYYQSNAKEPDFVVSTRCLEPFATCTQTEVPMGSPGWPGFEFEIDILPEESEEFGFARDYSVCSKKPINFQGNSSVDGCYITCHPSCTCNERLFTAQNTSLVKPCTIGTLPEVPKSASHSTTFSITGSLSIWCVYLLWYLSP